MSQQGWHGVGGFTQLMLGTLSHWFQPMKQRRTDRLHHQPLSCECLVLLLSTYKSLVEVHTTQT